MRISQFPRLAVALGIVVAAAACSDASRSPLAPRDLAPSDVAASVSSTTAKTKVAGIRWQTMLKADVSAGALIGPAGGSFRLAATGLTVVVPAGAVSQPTKFGVTALAGQLVAYDFQPAGSKFAKPLQLTQDGRYVQLNTRPDASAIPQGAYFPSTADLDQVNGTANVAERRPTTVSGTAITFTVEHFSGYMVSWGFR